MNRLRVDDKPGEDTRYHVRNVLRFMGDSFLAMEQAAEANTGFQPADKSMEGAYLIMAMCEEALREPDEEGGGTDGR